MLIRGIMNTFIFAKIHSCRLSQWRHCCSVVYGIGDSTPQAFYILNLEPLGKGAQESLGTVCVRFNAILDSRHRAVSTKTSQEHDYDMDVRAFCPFVAPIWTLNLLGWMFITSQSENREMNTTAFSSSDAPLLIKTHFGQAAWSGNAWTCRGAADKLRRSCAPSCFLLSACRTSTVQRWHCQCNLAGGGGIPRTMPQ